MADWTSLDLDNHSPQCVSVSALKRSTYKDQLRAIRIKDIPDCRPGVELVALVSAYIRKGRNDKRPVGS